MIWQLIFSLVSKFYKRSPVFKVRSIKRVPIPFWKYESKSWTPDGIPGGGLKPGGAAGSLKSYPCSLAASGSNSNTGAEDSLGAVLLGGDESCAGEGGGGGGGEGGGGGGGEGGA